MSVARFASVFPGQKKITTDCPKFQTWSVVTLGKLVHSIFLADVKFWCRDPGRHFCGILATVASGGTLDPKVMTLKDKDGTVQRIAFSTTLKKSSTEKAWNDHEERSAQYFQNILDLDTDFEELKQKEASAFSPMTDLGKACLKFIDASRKYNNEYPFGLPMLKNKYKEERNKVKKEMDNEIAQKFEKWCQMFFPLRGMMRLPEILIKESDFMNYCKLSGQWFRTRE